MNFRKCFGQLGTTTLAALVVASASLFTISATSAQAPTTPVGTPSATQTAIVTITTAGSAASIAVVTQGSLTSDYVLVPGGTCAVGTSYTAGVTCTVLYTFTPTHPFTRYGSANVSDGLGNLLGNVFLTGVGTGPQVSYALGATSVSALLGSAFSAPKGVAVDATGNIYVADTQNNVVKEVTTGGTIVTIATGFAFPAAVAIDGAGNIYVADAGNNAIKEIVAVNGSIPAVPVVLTLGSGFANPQGVAADGSGNVYVADTGNSLVKEILAVNGAIPATTPTINPLGSGFTTPVGVAVDASGNVYVADSAKTVVNEIVAGGSTTPITLGAGFSTPMGITVDSLGNVYVADQGNKVVKELLAVAGAVPTSSATIVTLGSGFASPAGLVVDASGDVFIADSGATSIEELNTQIPPSLTFASTVLGSVSTDSPQVVSVLNSGNAPLVFPVPGSASNPAISPSFGVGGTCPQVASTAGAAGSLAAAATCTYAVSFTPVTTGTLSGSLTLTDTSLNAAAATQTVTLGGISTPANLTLTVASPSSLVGATSVTLSATVPYAGVAPTGAFTFSINSGSAIAAACVGSGSGNGSPLTCTATYNPSSLTVTTYTIVGTIAADSNYNLASANGTLTVTQATPMVVLSTSGSPSLVDGTVTFTATVTPNSGIVPVGTVSFTTTFGGVTTPLCSSVALSAGKATCGTTALLAGSNSIAASLTGDTNFTTATATAITQTVTAASTTLTTTSSVAGSSTVDQGVTFTATLSSAAAFTIAPSGTVAFTVGGTTICPAAPISPTTHAATCVASALVAPSDVIGAAYTSGDLNFSGSTATAITQVVAKATTVNTISSNLATTAVVNQSVVFTATISPTGASSNGVTPTGNVIFTQGAASPGGTQLCSPVVVSPGAGGTGSASCSAAFSSVSAGLPIYAVYSSDSNFAVGNSPTLSQTVSSASASIAAPSIVTNPSSPTVNQTGVTLSATVTPSFTGTALPGGTVTFTDTSGGITPTSCVSTLVNGVVPPCSVVFTSTGTQTIKAVYSGDANFSATNTSTTVTIGSSGAVTINVATSATPVIENQAATYTAAFSPIQTGPTYPTGTVQFFDGATAIPGCNLTVSVTGTIPTCIEAMTTAGTHVISAIFTTTNSNFTNITSGNLAEVVNQNTTRTALTSPSAPATVDQIVTFSASITPTTLIPAATGTATPTGTVTFNYVLNGVTTALCGGVASTTGGVTTASCPASFPATPASPATTYSLTAVYNGDTNFTTSTSTAFAETVGKTSTVVGLASGTSPSSPASPVANQLTPYTVLITPSISDSGLTLPTGAVTFQDSAVPSATCTAGVVASTGQATCSFTDSNTAAITNGVHSIVATYSGDNNFSTSVHTFTVTIGLASPTITSITTNPSSPTVNQAVALNATISVPAGSTGLPTGSVAFSDTISGTTATACTSSVTAGVVAPCSYVFTVTGTHTLTAVYSGDSSFSTVTQTNTTISVGAAGSVTLNVTSSINPATVNQSATYTAAFLPLQTGPTYPTGSIQFFDGPTAIPGCNPSVSSTVLTATCTETLTTATTHVISAIFTTTNSNFTNITSGNLAQVANPNTTKTALTAPSAPASVDQIITFAATVTPSALTPAGSGTTVPSGTVVFSYLLNGVPTALCGGSVSTTAGVSSASCTASFPATPASPATAYSLTAVYNGDTNFSTSTSTAFSETVGKTGTSVGLVSGTSPSTPASPVANQLTPYVVLVSPSISDAGLTLPTGTVTFQDAAVPSATCTAGVVASSGQAACSFTDSNTAAITNGVHSIVATYSGDANFSTSVHTFTVTIGLANPTITSIVTNPSSPTVNLSVALNATITVPTGSTGLPTGTVAFSDTIAGVTTPACTSNVTAGVVAPCSYVFTVSGTHTLTAVYSGDSSFGTVTQTNPAISVGAAGAVTLNVTSSSNPATVNQSVTYTAAFLPLQGGPTYPTGTVQFYDGGTGNPIPSCNSSVSSSALTATCKETLTAATTHVISAIFTTTNSNFTNITSGNLAQVANQNTTKTVLTAPSAPASVNQVVTFAATVTASALTPAGVGTTVPSGTIAFSYLLNGVPTAICGGAVTTTAGVSSAACTASFPATPATPLTSYSVTAVYNGDANFTTSTSTAFSETVGKTPTAVGLVSGTSPSFPSSPVANQSTPYTVLITPTISDTGLTLPTGSVTFQDATVPSATCTAGLVASTGQATCSLTDSNTAAIVNGVHSIVATYSGDNNFGASVQTFSVTIGLASPTLTIFPSIANPAINQPAFSFNATIALPTGSTGLPTGSVTFTDSAAGTIPCTSTVAGGVVSPCPYTFGSAGTHSIKAVYSGDSSFGSATSTTSISVGMATPGITLSSSVSTSAATQPVTFTATVTPSPAAFSTATGTPTGAITFSFPANSGVTACTSTTTTSPGGTEVATCTVTFPATLAANTPLYGNFAVTARYAADANYLTNSTTISQTVQNFTATMTPASITLAQGAVSNLNDPYFGTAVSYLLTSQLLYKDATSSACSGTGGLTCILPTAPSLSTGAVPVVVTVPVSTAPGVYTVTVTTTDTGFSSLTQATTIAVTVIGRPYPGGQTTLPYVPYSVQTLGSTPSIPFTIPSTLTGSTYSCASAVGNLTTTNPPTYTQTGDTLASLKLACTITGSGSSYSVVITAGHSGTASLERGPLATANEIIAAGFLAPFLLLLGFSGSTRRIRKGMLRYMAIGLLGLAALYTTGCGGNGFSSGTTNTYAVGGQYLIGITNAQGVTVAEVPLLVTGNGSGI